MKIYNVIHDNMDADPEVKSFKSLPNAEFHARMKVAEYNREYGGDYSVEETVTGLPYYAYMDDVYRIMIVESELN